MILTLFQPSARLSDISVGGSQSSGRNRMVEVAIRAGFCQWWGIGGLWKQFPARFDGSNVYSYQSGLKCGVGGFPEGFRMKESKMEGEMEGWKKRSGMLLRGLLSRRRRRRRREADGVGRRRLEGVPVRIKIAPVRNGPVLMGYVNRPLLIGND